MPAGAHPAGAEGPGLPKAPSGITGLDEITDGGLPRGRVTLVTGHAGTGKSLLGMTFLVEGIRRYGEPGVLLTFEEPAAKVAADVGSLGFDLDRLQREDLLAVLSYPVDPVAAAVVGEFDLAPLLQALTGMIDRVGAKRAVLDGIDMLFSTLDSDAIVRSELIQIVRWLEERGVSTVVTGERGSEDSLTRRGIEEYVCDCVLALDHERQGEISTRHLQVVKYRGSTHGTNVYPFLISTRGISVQPVTSISLEYPVSDDRVSTGVERLDYLMGGGPFRGATVLLTGSAGTGKTSVGACMLDAACRRGERGLWVLLAESPDQVIRDMRSIGLDLRVHVDAGLLLIWGARPSAFGLESHLAELARLADDVRPSVAVLDGVESLARGATDLQVTSMVARQFDVLKTRGITTMATVLSENGETSVVNVSSLVDTWLLLRSVEANGERNRLIFVIKSRGTAHSNQVREFLITDHGIELTDVYAGPGGVLAGAARLAQQAAEREATERSAAERDRYRRELRRKIAEGETRLAVMRDEVDAERAELERIGQQERQRATAAEAERSEMAALRWADPEHGDSQPGRDGRR